MSRIFCIGDVHGCSATLESLLSNTISLNKNDKVIFIGDYIDRGHDSKGVIDIILDLYDKDYDVKCLMGNHEEMFIESHGDDEIYEHWVKRCGGDTTLSSFNITTYEDLHERYIYFFKTLLYYHTINKKYIFVHAGLNFRTNNIFQDRYAMLWERNTIIDHGVLADRYIIHGHTPQPIVKTEEQIDSILANKIVNIDNGCVFKDKDNFGYLTALELNSMQLYSIANID